MEFQGPMRLHHLYLKGYYLCAMRTLTTKNVKNKYVATANTCMET